MGGENQIKGTGASRNRNGHNVTDNGFIFDIPEGQEGYVAPRGDTIEKEYDSPDFNKGG